MTWLMIPCFACFDSVGICLGIIACCAGGLGLFVVAVYTCGFVEMNDMEEGI